MEAYHINTTQLFFSELVDLTIEITCLHLVPFLAMVGGATGVIFWPIRGEAG